MINIAFSGIDGAGKTTLIHRVKDHFQNEGLKVCLCDYKHQNYKSMISLESRSPNYNIEEIKAVSYSLDLLYQYLNIKEDDYDIALWDRSKYCIYAYFGAQNLRLDLAKKIMENVPTFQYYFYLDIGVEKSVQRLQKRAEEVKPRENFDFLSLVADEYKKVIKDSKVIIVNSDKPPDKLKVEILKYLEEF